MLLSLNDFSLVCGGSDSAKRERAFHLRIGLAQTGLNYASITVSVVYIDLELVHGPT